MTLVPKRHSQEFSWRHKFMTPKKKKKKVTNQKSSFHTMNDKHEHTIILKKEKINTFNKENKDRFTANGFNETKKIKKKQFSWIFSSFRNNKKKTTKYKKNDDTYEFCNSQFSKLEVNDLKCHENKLQLFSSVKSNGMSIIKQTLTNNGLQSILTAISYVEKELCEKGMYTFYDIVHFYKDQCHDENEVYMCTQLLIQQQQQQQQSYNNNDNDEMGILGQNISNFSIHSIANSIRNILNRYEPLIPFELLKDSITMINDHHQQQLFKHFVPTNKWKETTSTTMFMAFIHHFANLYTSLPHDNKTMTTTDCTIVNDNDTFTNTMDWKYMNSLAYTFADSLIQNDDIESRQEQPNNEMEVSSIEPKNKEPINTTTTTIEREMKAKMIMSMIECTIRHNAKQTLPIQYENTNIHKLDKNHHVNHNNNSINKGYDSNGTNSMNETYMDGFPILDEEKETQIRTCLNMDKQLLTETKQEIHDDTNESWNKTVLEEENLQRRLFCDDSLSNHRLLMENAKRRLTAASQVIRQIDQVMLKESFSH